MLTTNLQTNGIIAGLNINWPSSLRSIQNIFNVVQSSMVNTVSMDCSLQYWDSPIMSQAQIEAVIAMLVPIGMLGIFLLMWTCRSGPLLALCILHHLQVCTIFCGASCSTSQALCATSLRLVHMSYVVKDCHGPCVLTCATVLCNAFVS